MFEHTDRKDKTKGIDLRMPGLVLGLILILTTGILAARLIWEMTFLTWTSGPQMIGFTLAHGPWAFLFLAPFLLAIWLFLSLGIVITRKFKKRSVPRSTEVLVVVAAVILALIFLPQGFWNTVFAKKLATSPYSTKFLIGSAALGEKFTVKALIHHGVSVNQSDEDLVTALHAAAGRGETPIVELLLSKGAEINALDLAGTSPLHYAVEGHHQAMIELLKAKGGQDIAPSHEHYDEFIGEYEFDSRDIAIIGMSGSNLTIRLNDAPEQLLIPTSDRTFFIRNNRKLEISFSQDSRTHSFDHILVSKDAKQEEGRKL